MSDKTPTRTFALEVQCGEDSAEAISLLSQVMTIYKHQLSDREQTAISAWFSITYGREQREADDE